MVKYAQKVDILRNQLFWKNSNIKVHGANMGPIWGRQDPGGPHVGPMNFAIWDCLLLDTFCFVTDLVYTVVLFKSIGMA